MYGNDSLMTGVDNGSLKIPCSEHVCVQNPCGHDEDDNEVGFVLEFGDYGVV